MCKLLEGLQKSWHDIQNNLSKHIQFQQYLEEIMHYHQDIFVLKYWMSNYLWQLELQREKKWSSRISDRSILPTISCCLFIKRINPLVKKMRKESIHVYNTTILNMVNPYHFITLAFYSFFTSQCGNWYPHSLCLLDSDNCSTGG